MLWLRLGDRAVSLFAANDGFPCRVRYEPGLATWEKELPTGPVTTETWIPRSGDFRVLRIRGARGLSLIWALRPRLSDEDSAGLRCRLEDGLFRAENPDCPWPELRFLAGSGSFFLGRTDFRPAALRMELEAEEETLLVCGCGAERELRRLCTAEGAARSREETLAFWREKCFRLRLETGSPALDHYLNGWAVYQTLCCRLWGRGSLYQSGGAYGFRDQLQDAVNLLPVDPGLARERILDACRHQYAQGDVMHWWHPLPDGDRGIRSRCGDDLLWLPWALAEYVRATGDEALCFREEPVLLSPPLRKEERDRYETAEAGPGRTVLAHAESALLLAESRGTGPHGLPFFGSGDWNDGLDAVDGESLWLGWFLAHTARNFARLLDRLGQPGAGRWRALAGKMEKACEGGWNGRWYDRGYWTDGEALGGRERIDSLAQSWAALCPNAHGGRVRLALEEACQRLADEEKRLVKLFSPPFGPEERYPGYLAGYGAGFRENGGQYTHAGVWLALALLRRGEREKEDGCWSFCWPRAGSRAVMRPSPLSWPRTSALPRDTRGRRAGPGTPARRAGSSGPPWRSWRVCDWRMAGSGGKPGRTEFGSFWTVRNFDSKKSRRCYQNAGAYDIIRSNRETELEAGPWNAPEARSSPACG